MKNMKMPKDVEAKVSMPSDEAIKDAAEMAGEALVELGVLDRMVDVSTGYPPEEGKSHGRVDSPNGALKYFRERFKKFVK